MCQVSTTDRGSPGEELRWCSACGVPEALTARLPIQRGGTPPHFKWEWLSAMLAGFRGWREDGRGLAAPDVLTVTPRRLSRCSVFPLKEELNRHPFVTPFGLFYKLYHFYILLPQHCPLVIPQNYHTRHVPSLPRQ